MKKVFIALLLVAAVTVFIPPWAKQVHAAVITTYDFNFIKTVADTADTTKFPFSIEFAYDADPDPPATKTNQDLGNGDTYDLTIDTLGLPFPHTWIIIEDLDGFPGWKPTASYESYGLVIGPPTFSQMDVSDKWMLQIRVTGFNSANTNTPYLNVTWTNHPVPEPSTMLLLGSGLAGLIGYGRRRFKM